jgi:Mg2+ and Co2+ transporter CorA
VQRPRQDSLPFIGGVAAEPGLDYRMMDVEGFDNYAEVTVTDYSAQQCSSSNRMGILDPFEEFFECDRPSWAKVRWINVDGLNWQCIKFLALKYNLHRLAIEDLLSVQRTKIDLYKDRIISSFEG